MNQPALRSYVLALGDEGAAMMRQGMANPLAAGMGRDVAEGRRLCRMLFSVCPRAHETAFLRAVGQITGAAPSPGEAAAAEAVLLSESLAAHIFRCLIVWPGIFGLAAQTAPVAAARDAATRLPGLLAQGELRRADREAILHRLAEANAAAKAHILPALAVFGAGSHDAALPGDCAALGDAIGHAHLTPGSDPREETPWSGPCEGRRVSCLFRAGLGHGDALLVRFEAAVATATKPAAAPAAGRRSGEGVGVALTARGRLRHVVTIEDGAIAAWRAEAPTDWNFAPQGPVARAASRLGTGPEACAQAKALVAAFDPCAPVQVTSVFTERAAHA